MATNVIINQPPNCDRLQHHHLCQNEHCGPYCPYLFSTSRRTNCANLCFGCPVSKWTCVSNMFSKKS